MSIIEEIKRQDAKKVKINDKAVEIYEKQVRAIQAIKNTEGFKEMLSYWEREQDTCEKGFPVVGKEDLKELQTRYTIASSFLTFMKNLEKGKEKI